MSTLNAIAMLLQATVASVPADPPPSMPPADQKPAAVEGASLLDAPVEKSTTGPADPSAARPLFRTVQRFIVRRIIGTSGDVFIVDVQEQALTSALQSALIVEQITSEHAREAVLPQQ